MRSKTAKANEPRVTPDTIGQGSAVARDSNANGAQNGRQARGMYPQVSRTKLAEVTGKDITTISQIMRGRNRPKFEDAIRIAKVVGVSPERFAQDLEQQREKFKKAERLKTERAARAKDR